MTDPIEPLVLDLLEWVGPDGRAYHEVMEAWCTSCPRLPIWEEATSRGLVARTCRGGRSLVVVTPLGSGLVADRRRA